MYREPYYDERDVEDGGNDYQYFDDDEDDEPFEVVNQKTSWDFETIPYQPPVRRKEVR